MPLPEWLSSLWYDFNYAVSWASLSLGFSFRHEGGRNVPARGPALLIANHQSFLDPLMVGLATRRHLNFLARKTLFKHPLFGAFLRSVNCLPVDQEGIAKEGLKTSLAQLQAGHALLVFPEGERTWTGKMQKLKPGISLLIKRALAPIVPVGVAGAFEAYPRTAKFPHLSPLFLPPAKGTTAVSVGKPLDPRRYAEMPREQMLDELFNEIQTVQQRAEKLRRKG
jgi:1-acyl-sn-glycerol-3-phosphate acyltransferase